MATPLLLLGRTLETGHSFCGFFAAPSNVCHTHSGPGCLYGAVCTAISNSTAKKCKKKETSPRPRHTCTCALDGTQACPSASVPPSLEWPQARDGKPCAQVPSVRAYVRAPSPQRDPPGPLKFLPPACAPLDRRGAFKFFNFGACGRYAWGIRGRASTVAQMAHASLPPGISCPYEPSESTPCVACPDASHASLGRAPGARGTAVQSAAQQERVRALPPSTQVRGAVDRHAPKR